jgi:hypothetical protein
MSLVVGFVWSRLRMTMLAGEEIDVCLLVARKRQMF